MVNEPEQQDTPDDSTLESDESNTTWRWAGALVLVVLAGGALYYYTQPSTPQVLGKPHSHIDFVVVLNDERIDLSDDKYMSRPDQILHPDLHLHDNNQNVLHIHKEGLTMAEFFASIGFTLTDECITTDTSESYCSNENATLQMYVDGELVTSPANHIPTNETRLLVYYGDPNSPSIQNHQNSITDEACIYTGTCPERGTPPPEACGLTCEI